MLRNTLSRSLVLLLLSIGSMAAAAASAVGTVEYLEGDVSLTRAGAVLKDLDIGDPIENFDLIKTGTDGSVIIALSAETGMNGTLTVKPKSVFSVKTESVKGVPATEGDMIAGSVAVKAKKIAGDPSLRLRTTSTVMGVRGTQFEVVISVNDSILVGCSEGRVACSDEEGASLDAVPGKSVLRSAGEPLANVPVAVSDLETFRKNWIADEIDAFRADPVRALDQYGKAYRRYKAEFKTAFDPLAADSALGTWSSEYRRGVTPRANDVAVMNQKSQVAPKLMKVRRVLFFFERVYWRLNEIQSIAGSDVMRKNLPSGGRVSDLYAEIASDKAELEKKTAAYRFALRLYAERNEGREPFADDGDGGDFFDDTSGFFD